ncbi:MAG: PLD nuclease N-terminal domain-containing protein [Candidatus Omnitrophica bacterium]|nr:PLD nuclease N-terminal domain-containing protein [Candidatus Omnitrophota bacterium]MDD5236159.1 PLD nuclease N-terminal domain-containing protein [Candidatus Omnitrophota bacterium]MDD5611363.1 PLD nuclease N-terminal domain-containing protein [Candidatus Omnitrophota bacterium]
MFIFLITLILILDLWAVVDVLKMERETDLEKKFLWIIVIISLPLAGVILYVLLGSRRIR